MISRTIQATASYNDATLLYVSSDGRVFYVDTDGTPYFGGQTASPEVVFKSMDEWTSLGSSGQVLSCYFDGGLYCTNSALGYDAWVFCDTDGTIYLVNGSTSSYASCSLDGFTAGLPDAGDRK